MALTDEFRDQGEWLFRWRSYLPLVLVPLVGVAIAQKEIRDVTAFDPSERAALALTEAMTRVADGGRVNDATWASAREHFDDASLACLVEVIALINAFNRINVATARTAEDYVAYASRRRSVH